MVNEHQALLQIFLTRNRQEVITGRQVGDTHLSRHSIPTGQTRPAGSRQWLRWGDDEARWQGRLLHRSVSPSQTSTNALLSWQMKLLSQYPFYLRSCGSRVKFPLTGKGKNTPYFSKGKEGRPTELPVSQSHLCTWQDHGADLPGNYAKAHGK